MKSKLAFALLAAGIAALSVSTALVSALPSTRSVIKTASVHTSSVAPETTFHKTGQRRIVAPATRAVTGGKSVSTSSTRPAAPPPSTAFVVSTITYDVKQGDTVSTIAHWFDQQGYSRQFAANLQVIDLNRNLLVPGALVSISNGVMTIQSPA